MNERLKIIALGQGQGVKAAVLIEEGKREGNWVCLLNCHLARTWMPDLEVIIENIPECENVHADFRLFLTSMPASYFPISTLQNGIKITTEPPRGLKSNLKRSWESINEEFLSGCSKPEVFHKLTWGLTFFHAIVQERRKFGPLGWNIRYEFNDSDLETSTTVMKMLLNEQEQIPWDALTFVTGEINYGGRVTDDWDRRCLKTILKKFYVKEALEGEYHFSDSQVYKLPLFGEVDVYKQYIDSLPMNEDPTVFGMNENANIAYQAQESSAMLETILSIQPRMTSAAAGKSPDQVVMDLKKSLQEQTPDLMSKEDGLKEMFEINEKGLIPSLSTVLLQEMQKFNTLLSTITKTLTDLGKAIDGDIVMSSELDETYNSLLNNQVPKLWQKVAYPSLKPLASWIVDLRERVQFMFKWLKEGYPLCYWISGFFFPQGFVTGVLQTHSRNHQIAIDKLVFNFKILDLDKETCTIKPSDGVYIYGLFLEGAQWDRKKKSVLDAMPNQTYCAMPLIHFNPTENYQEKMDHYICPVYKTSLRAGVLSTTGQSTNFVLTVDLPTLEQMADFWVLRGVALLCQLNQ